MSLTNAQLSADIAALLNRVTLWQSQYDAWQGGSATGGPNHDGRYPLTDEAGVARLVYSPAALEAAVAGPRVQAETFAIAAEASRQAAQAASTLASHHEEFAEAARTASQAARDLTKIYRDQVEGMHANVVAYAGSVGANAAISSADRLIVQGLAANAANSASDAASSAGAAALSAANAATFNPALFDAKTDSISSARLTGMIDPARIPVLVSQYPVVSGGGIANLSLLQQSGIGPGTIVATTDGKRWVYSGNGSKTSEASFIEQGDVTPVWGAVADKPFRFQSNVALVDGLQTVLDSKLATSSLTWANVGSKPLTFAPSAHGHAWSEITGVPSSFAPTAHTHDWSEVTGKPSVFASNIANVSGLQGALDGKLETTALTWTNVGGKPSTFAPSAHSHDAADVVSGTLADARIPTIAISKTSGLQSALDAKLASTTASTTYLAKSGNSVRIDNSIAPGQVSIAATAGSAAGFGVYSRSITIGGGFADPSRFWFGVRGTNTDADFGYLSTGTTDPYASINALRIYPTYPAWGTNVIWHAGNDGSGSGLDADLLDGYHAASFAWRSTPASDVAFDSGVSQVLRWKHYGTSHVIIDASNSTAPNGAAINSTNPTVAWTPTYPTLMGWNGSATYGVRVDSARSADILGGLQASSFLRSEAPNQTVSVTATAASGVKFWDGNDAYSIRMSDVGNGTFGGRVSGDTASDYNMYFRMTGTARGFVFQNNSTNVAGIDGYGNGRFTGDVFTKGTRVPVTTYSQAAPSGGVDGDVHIVW
ncbi:MAG: hypothetical protein ACK4UQ_06630 [Brevundimonas sp.]